VVLLLAEGDGCCGTTAVMEEEEEVGDDRRLKDSWMAALNLSDVKLNRKKGVVDMLLLLFTKVDEADEGAE
jgi:hypothetical protein